MKISIAKADGVITYQETIESTLPVSNEKTNSFSQVMHQATVADKCDNVKTYQDIFIEAANKYGVDYNLLVAMAKQESGFNAKAVSHSGAMGVMQLMPATAAELGVEDPFDAYENIMGGAKYIAEKLAYYNGDVELALAAYNAGSGAVAAYDGIPPFEETQNYVRNITAMMKNGVTVPVKNYVDKNASREDLEADLKKLLSEFPDKEEYSVLKNILLEINYL